MRFAFICCGILLLAFFLFSTSYAEFPPPIKATPTKCRGIYGKADHDGYSCAQDPRGWCCSSAGEPCGVYNNVADCKSDNRCRGMAYRGESVIACIFDERGFGVNCPTVGCESAPSSEDKSAPSE